MNTRTALLIGLLVAGAGCLSDEQKLTTVPSSPFGKSPRTQTASFKQAPKATQEMSLKVDRIGKKLVAANPRITQKIVFMVIGQPHEEIFHQTQKDVSTILITEELAKQCKTEGELAAVLSEELGRVMSEQMVQARPARKPVPTYLTTIPSIGNDFGGAISGADRSGDMLVGHFEKEMQQTRPSLPAAPPPPETLARVYLSRAGFNPKELEAVAPLLRKAEKQSSVEQAMNGKQSG